MKYLLWLSTLLLFAACHKAPETVIQPWLPYDESAMIGANADHESERMRFKLIQSRVRDRNDLWQQVGDQIKEFSEQDYEALKSMILEQDIPTIQGHIETGRLTYELLTQWYLYRIVKFENDSAKTLNCIISINPNAVEEAKRLDQEKPELYHPIYGMPVLLKDNVNAEGMATTAGAHILLDNTPDDAFITARIREKGGIILGKTSLSEWANFMCLGCPNGWSAVGGQTLNPYGRGVHDTGGSSSGSGAAMAANYAAAAVGSETSGSILSPSSGNSLVGLKPTIGLLSRGGVVPISSTLDTPGPMTKSVLDNAILLDAMTGQDEEDPATAAAPTDADYLFDPNQATLEGLRFGALKRFLEDSVYRLTVGRLEKLGATVVQCEGDAVQLEGFGDLLRADMRLDLAAYFERYTSENISAKTVNDVLAFNQVDSASSMPYGQGRIAGVLDVDLTAEELVELRRVLQDTARYYFDRYMDTLDLDGILAINNYGAGYAAAAKYPCLTVPMGYEEGGRPMGITFIAKPFEEDKLLKWGYAFELATAIRKMPVGYDE
ncbi:MAG: amidase family protein [Bacteroidota bacterium]